MSVPQISKSYIYPKAIYIYISVREHEFHRGDAIVFPSHKPRLGCFFFSFFFISCGGA